MCLTHNRWLINVPSLPVPAEQAFLQGWDVNTPALWFQQLCFLSKGCFFLPLALGTRGHHSELYMNYLVALSSLPCTGFSGKGETWMLAPLGMMLWNLKQISFISFLEWKTYGGRPTQCWCPVLDATRGPESFLVEPFPLQSPQFELVGRALCSLQPSILAFSSFKSRSPSVL